MSDFGFDDYDYYERADDYNVFEENCLDEDRWCEEQDTRLMNLELEEIAREEAQSKRDEFEQYFPQDAEGLWEDYDNPLFI